MVRISLSHRFGDNRVLQVCTVITRKVLWKRKTTYKAGTFVYALPSFGPTNMLISKTETANRLNNVLGNYEVASPSIEPHKHRGIRYRKPRINSVFQHDQ